MKLINADALIKTIGSHCYLVRQKNNSIEPGMTWSGIMQAIQEQPTVEERKTGEWTKNNSCPFCGFLPWYESDIHTLSFCPNCGSDMRGEQDDIR